MKGSKWTWSVIVAGIALRLILWAFQASPEGDDGMRYLSESVNLVRHGVFSSAPFQGECIAPAPTAHDLPLWPAIMAVYLWATDSIPATQWLAGLTNIFLCALGAWLLGSMLRSKLFGLSDGQTAVGCGIYLFMPETIVYSLFHMPDQLAVTAIIVALWFYFRSITISPRYLVGAVTSFVAAIYAKPICFPLSLALTVFLLLMLKGAYWKRIVIVLACGLAGAVCFCPWLARNRAAFGTMGLTTIAGTNLYACNWGGLVERLPIAERAKEKKSMRQLEESLANDDLMRQSQAKGDYAKKRILAHLPAYAAFTCQRHPRLYAGTGTVALLRYLGCERICDCLDSLWGSGTATGKVITPTIPYSLAERAIGVSVQVLSWIALLTGYVLVLLGIWRWGRVAVSARENRSFGVLVWLCPILSLVLLAAVIGPVTATRYRFVMIPFFAILAAYAALPATAKFGGAIASAKGNVV